MLGLFYFYLNKNYYIWAMAEQQLTPTPQEDNQELYTPNVAEFAGYDKELFGNADSANQLRNISGTERIETLEDEKIDYKSKNAISTLNSVVETSTEKQAVDVDGNLDFTNKLDNSVSILASQEMPDPTLEEERKKLQNDIKTRRDEEVNGLQDEVNQKIASGEVSEKRRQKYIDKRTKEIDKKYKEEFNGGVLELNDKGKKGKTVRQINREIKRYDRGIENLLKYANKVAAGDRLKLDDIIRSSVNPEFETKYQETKKKGVTNMAQFEDDWVNGKGNIKEGDVILGYMTGGYYTDEAFKKSSRPIYYQAVKDQDGNNIVKPVEQAFVHPITGEILGAYLPNRYERQVEVVPDYTYIAGKTEFLKGIDESVSKGYIDAATGEKKKQKFLADRVTRVKKNIEAFNKIISSNKYSKNVKLAVVASVFPNQFKEKYDELVNSGDSDIVGSILKYSVGLPFVIAGGALEGISMGIDEAVQAIAGLDDVEFPMGTLALEISKNPDIARQMDNILKGSYDRSSKYTSSIEGLAELTKAAKITVRNKDINTAITMAQSILPAANNLVSDLNNTKLLTEASVTSYATGANEILKKSGYLDAFNNYLKLNNELTNSPDEDIRNAYRFLKLKQQILNYDGPASQALSSLKKEDIEFINTVGADLTKNNVELLNTVVGKINEIVALGEKARSLYPSKEIADYDAKNKGKLESALLDYNKKRDAVLNSELFSARGGEIMDIIEGLYDQYDTDGTTETYSFPILSRQGYQIPRNALLRVDPMLNLGISILSGTSQLLRGGAASIAQISGSVGLDFDLNRRYVSSSLQEWKRYYETDIPETGIYAVDIAKSIGGALPQMAAFVAATVLGGPVGAVGYLTLSMAGDKMKEAAEQGLQPIDQMLYAGLSIGIEYASELVTPEVGLLGIRVGKSVLTKNLLNRIMNTGTRKEALKEYAGLIWKTSKNLVKQGTLESFENHVSDKANFVLQSMFNSVYATTFEPSVMSFKQSTDDIVTSIGVTALFKGGTAMFRKAKGVESKTKEDIKKRGFNDDQASILAASSTPSGLKKLIDFVNQVESGEIASDNINKDMYDFLKNKVIPNAMALQTDLMTMSSNPNISLQQRTVALFNLMQINEINGMVERGEVVAASAETLAQQYRDNANKALQDKAFADEQFGLDNTGLAQKIKEYFGIADMRVNEEGALDATPVAAAQPAAVATAEALPAESTAQDVKQAEAEKSAQDAASQSTNTVNPSALKEQAAAQVQTEAVSEAATTGGTAAITTSATAEAAAETPTVSPTGFEVMDSGTLADRIVSIVAAPLRKFKARASKESAIRKNPEKALSMEIFGTRAQLEIAQDRYNEAVKAGELAPVELTEIKILQERLNNLAQLKDNYFKTKQYATEISDAIRQEIGERRNSVQYPGTKEGQLEEGERERREREETESTANYRNSNFGSQAQAAVQEIAQVPEQPPIMQTYMGGMQPGQEVQLMDEIASQVAIDEPAAVRQFGQPIVDRVKQYMSETNFTTDLPVVRQAMVRQAEQRLNQAIEEANTVIARQNQNTSKQHKKAVVKLVERLKQAFPNVKVFMDKKGFEAAIQDPAARELMTKGGIVYGRILNGDVYLNPDFSNYNTPIHEFGHLWLNVAKEMSQDAYNRGIELIRDSEYITRLEGDPLYNGLTKEELEEEALATAIGDRGEKLVFESQKKGFRGWMTRLLRKMAQYVGIMNMSSSELRSLDLDTYLNMVNASLLAGEPITFNKLSERGNQFEARAFHGSPYAFDRFTTQAIGTGEGNQSFGWGLYFTELADIARRYAKEGELRQLENSIGDYTFDGDDIGQQLIDFLKAGGEISDWIKRREELLKNRKEQIASGEDFRGTTMANIIERLEFSINSAKQIQDKISRNVYDVTIHKGKQPSEYNWLVWDKKPNREQVSNLISKLNQKQRDAGFYYGLAPNATNKDLYKGLSRALGGDKQASLFLLENGIDGIKYPAESLSKGKTSETAIGFNYVVFDENAVTIEQRNQFMAKMDNGVKNALTRVAQEEFNTAIARGMDLEAARSEAFTKVTEFVIVNYLNKSNYAEILDGLSGIVMNVSEAQRQRVVEQKKNEKLSQLFKFPEIQAIATMANEEALKLAQGKVKASDAVLQVIDKVKAEVEALFAGNKAPVGVSWINAMALAPSIAADAVMAAFPATNRSSLVNEDIVTMSSSKYIRNAVFNQINAIKDVEKRAEGIKAAVKDIFKQMSDAYGKGLKLSTAQVNAIISEIDANVFSREDIMSATEEAANAVSNIIEKEYRNKLIAEIHNDKSSGSLDKLKSKISKAKYTGKLLDKTMQLINIDINSWKNSNATLEDISQFNTAINNILANKVVNWNLDFAITKAGDIQIDNDAKIRSEYDSLISKMNRMIDKAGNLDLSDYASIAAFNNAMEDVKERKGALAAFTPEQMAKIEQKYRQVLASIPGTLSIDEILAQKETEITNAVKNKAELLASELESETSDIRMRVKNPLMYHRIILFSKFILKGDYIDSLDIKGKLALINAIDNVMMYGNPNHDVYIQDIKARKYYFKTNTIGWAMNMAKRRRYLAAPGLTGLIANKFENFARVFTDVEGTTPSAQLIADNFDLLRLHSMDVELFGGYDIFDMGFLEREIFAPMASGIDGAVNRTQAKLQPLQDAMLLLGDKSSRNAVKKALKGIRDQYGVGSDLNIRRFFAMFKRGSNDNMYVEISTRMASIISHQIDHISNLKEGQKSDDMILKRNILDGIAEDKKDGMTMFDRYGKLGSLSTLTGKYDDFLDAIAYSALTNNGTETLAGLTQEQLLNKLTPSQKKAINSWRDFINANKDLVESAMIIRGNMKALIKNYFPRMLSSSQDIRSIGDSESYLNSQFENVGLRDGQISSRIADKGKMSLNGNKVLLNNLKALHLLNEMQPYIDQIKGINEAVEELNALALKTIDESKKRELNFAAAYAEGISITIKNRLDNSLLNGDKSINNNYNFVANLIGVTQKFAAKLWLTGTMRQLGSDYPANIVKTSAALAAANKSAKMQTFRLLSPSKSSIRTQKGKFVWDDYVKIAELTGSPVYRTVSMYSDNFLYDYTKTPAELQREQKVMSWQDMAVKKQAWMERFENAFTKLTGEVFDHKAFEDERGSYRAMFYEAVHRASSAADSTVDRQFGLPSFARQPLKTNVFFPFVGRPLRYLFNTYKPSWVKYLSISKTSWVGTITGYMMGYPSVQHSLFRNYIKLSFTGTSGLTLKERSKYMAQSLTEAFIPTFFYGLSRAFFGALFIGTAAAVRSAAGDEEEEKKIREEMDNQNAWQRMLTSFKLKYREAEDVVFDNIINSLTANVVDPQTTYLLRMAAGLWAFQYWKKEAIIAMDTREVEYEYEYQGQILKGKRKMSKEERTAMGKEIKKKENRIWNMFNVRPLEIYGGQDYEAAMQKRDVAWAGGRATQGWEELFESIGGFGEVAKTARSVVTIKELFETDNEKLNRSELLMASILKGYALLFTNYMIGGKYGWVASMFTGDANKIANTILKDLEAQNREYEKEKQKKSKGGFGGGRRTGARGSGGRSTGGR